MNKTIKTARKAVKKSSTKAPKKGLSKSVAKKATKKTPSLTAKRVGELLRNAVYNARANNPIRDMEGVTAYLNNAMKKHGQGYLGHLEITNGFPEFVLNRKTQDRISSIEAACHTAWQKRHDAYTALLQQVNEIEIELTLTGAKASQTLIKKFLQQLKGI